MNKNKKSMVLASFLADSLSLGAHWIYDTNQIVKTHGLIESLLAPGPGSYHSTKDAGDFTHYADQAFVLLESIVHKKAFDLSDFSNKWRNMFADYNGYIDGATQKTLLSYAEGKSPENAGSSVSDFGGASRIAPLIYLYHDDIDKLIVSVRSQTAMTHNDILTIDTAEFFARTAGLVLSGALPTDAIKQTAELEHFEMSPIPMWVKDGLNTKNQETIGSIAGFGQACSTSQVFPGVIHLIAKYENNLKQALIQSVMAGGDSASRGSITGMILGAHLGMESLPKQWLDSMNKTSEIIAMLNKIS